MKSLAFIFLLWMVAMDVHGQGHAVCDTVYKIVDHPATFSGGTVGLARYMNKEMMSAVNTCYQQDGVMITRLTMTLVIGLKGQVVGVTFEGTDIPTGCKERLRKKLLAMTGWVAARQKGTAVCSYYQWTVGCILWEEE